MRFRFEFKPRWLLVTGLADEPVPREIYRRSGSFELRAGRFVCKAINDGRPVRLNPLGDDLFFVIDDSLSIRLKRLSPFPAPAK